jgi:phosphomannomutase
VSRHLPERDGLLNSLLLANVMADERKTLGQLVASLQEEFGEHHYGRVDMHIAEEIKQSAIARAKTLQVGATAFAGRKILRVETLDGMKFFLENPACADKKNAAETWLLLRASGTEPLLRVYCESCSPQSVQEILAAAQAFVMEGRKG